MSGMIAGEFARVFNSGGFRMVGVTGAGGSFCVTAVTRSGTVVGLMATRCRRQFRTFRRPGPAIALLYAMGVRKMELDLARWSADQVAPVKRPDVAARMKRAHAAVGK